MSISYDRLKRYLQTLSADIGDAVSEALADRVPLFISACYSACRARVFGAERLVLLCRHEQTLSPEQIRVHAAILSQHYDFSPLFVFQHGTREFCTALIAAKVPFAIIGRQVFIPGVALAITEAGFSKAKPASPRRFSPLAQVIVLYHLLHRAHGHELPFQLLLTDLKINKVYISRCAREVENAGLAQILALGRRKQLVFLYERRKIWEMAQSLLTSPVQRTTRLERLPPGLPLAGLSALSALSNLNDDPIPTYAVYAKALTLAPGVEREYSGSYVELWKYDPALLCGQSATVDKLSLFLSLETNGDPRVHSERDAMMEALPW